MGIKHPSNLKKKGIFRNSIRYKEDILENPLDGNFMTPLDGDFIVKYNKKNDRTIITIENQMLEEIHLV
jgi:hypothetical protein